MDAPGHFNGHGVGGDESVVVEVFAHAAQGVARGHALRAVGVEHPHSRIRPVGALHENKAVGPNAGVPVAQ